MKHSFAILLAFCFFASCNNTETTKTMDKKDSTGGNENTKSTDAQNAAVAKECYEMTNVNDSVFVQLNINNSEVNGTMFTQFAGKDQNNGTFTGTMIGDTLLADYTFTSEGMQSVRQVAFLKKGNQLVQGFGEIRDQDGKMVFRNKAQLNFDAKMTLNKVACNE